MGDARLVSSAWEFSSMGPDAENYIQTLIESFPSVCIRLPDGSPIAWNILQENGAMGMLYVHPKYRSKGLDLYVVTKLTKRLLESGQPAFAVLFKDNSTSKAIVSRVGFTYCRNDHWLIHSPTKQGPHDGV